MILGNPPRGQAEMMIGREIEFFLWSEMYVNVCPEEFGAGSLTSTYRVVRKYNLRAESEIKAAEG